MKFEIKVAKEVAEKNVSDWLDFKLVDPDVRDANPKAISKLVSSVMYGRISIDTNGNITHNLAFPIKADKEGAECKSFTYKGRLNVDEIEACLAAGGSTRVYGAALTGESSGYFGKLDTADVAILNAVVVFFTN